MANEITSNNEAIEIGGNISNNDKAEIYVKKAKAFVDQVIKGEAHPPIRQGRVNVSALAEYLGFDRERFHTNDGLKEQLERLREHLGETPMTNPNATYQEKYVKALEQRIKTLEERLAIKTSEVEELREQLGRRDLAEEHMIRTGRIVHDYFRPNGNGGVNE